LIRDVLDELVRAGADGRRRDVGVGIEIGRNGAFEDVLRQQISELPPAVPSRNATFGFASVMVKVVSSGAANPETESAVPSWYSIAPTTCCSFAYGTAAESLWQASV
jgi:hypothetical protein